MSLQFGHSIDFAVDEAFLTTKNDDEHFGLRRGDVNHQSKRLVHIVKIILKDDRLFSTVLALANVIETNASNAWRAVHRRWEADAGSCMTLRFDQASSPARLALELKRLVPPAKYRFQDVTFGAAACS